MATYSPTISSPQQLFHRKPKAAALASVKPVTAYCSCGGAGIPADPYVTLGLNRGAPEHDIKRAYRKLALQFHPDVCKGDLCTVRFTEISDAYQAIMDCLRGNGSICMMIDGDAPRPETMMGVNDDSWEEWEEWMGWEGAGTRDYSNHINGSWI